MSIQAMTDQKYFLGFLWTWLSWLLLLLFFLAGVDASAQTDMKAATAIRTLYPSEWGVPYPAGVAYLSDHEHIALMAKSVDPALSGTSTVVVITPYEDLVGTTILPFVPDNALNLTYDGTNDRLLLLNSSEAELAQVLIGDTGVPDPTSLIRFNAEHLSLQGANGLAVTPEGNRLFILDSETLELLSVVLDESLKVVSRIDLSILGAGDLRGLAIHPFSQNIFTISPTQGVMYEITLTGRFVDVYDLAALELIDPRGFAFGPSADLTDPTGTMHLFLADSNLPDAGFNEVVQPRFGRLLEAALDMETSAGRIRAVVAQVASSTDDSEEKIESGATSLDSTDLELSEHRSGDQLVGLRFGGIAIPPGVKIVDAYIEFVADTKGLDPATLIIRGEAINDAAPFADKNSDISERNLTLAFVDWPDIPPWEAVHTAYYTPDLSAIVREIIERPDWQSGNAIVFILAGTGTRTAEAYDGEASLAPRLFIQYQDPTLEPTPTPTNPFPSILATPAAAQTDD